MLSIDRLVKVSATLCMLSINERERLLKCLGLASHYSSNWYPLLAYTRQDQQDMLSSICSAIHAQQ